MGALSSLKKAKPLVSKFDEALANLSRPKGTGNEFLTEVMKQPGVKKAEIEDRKLKQAFEKAGKITKEQAQEIAQKNAATKLEDKVLRDPTKKELAERAHEMAYDDAFDELRAEGVNRHEATDIAAEMAEDRIEQYMDAAAEELADSGSSPYHGNFALPGGENYREILLKMPAFEGDRKISEIKSMLSRVDPEFHPNRHKELTGQLAELEAQKAAMPAQFAGDPRHFGGEPGVIASLRVKDRVGPNGEKILHVEEIQSDWHQKARDARNKEIKRIVKEEGIPKKEAAARVPENYGYQTAETDARRKELLKMAAPYIDRNEAMPKEIYNELMSLPNDLAPPDAPFKKNWHEVALKKALNYAVENGYDRIAITPGAEHVSRYDLSKHLKDVHFDPSTGHLAGRDHQGKLIVAEQGVTPDNLSEYIGKEGAQKILEATPDNNGVMSLSGTDLKIGGKGMLGFYDKMLPDYLNTLGKKYGSQVGVYDMPNPKTGLSITDIQREQGLTDQQWLDLSGDEKMRLIDEMDAKAKANTTPLHTFDITPQLREEITTKGLPLYQQIGLPIGTGVGSYEFNAPEPEYAEGGAVNYNTQPDMNDGGAIIQGAPYKRGGKVKITDNLDEMFMEVNNKKFQRK